jgi:hypothetical protein
MKHLERIVRAAVAELHEEVASQPDAWTLFTGRQDRVRAYRDTRSIPIRGVRKSAIGNRARRDVHESRWTTTSNLFPLVQGFLEGFALVEDVAIGRAQLVELRAGGRIGSRKDKGDYFALRDRYHLVITAGEGCTLRVLDERVPVRSGDVWWIDNKRTHREKNESDAASIMLAFDAMPNKLAARSAQPVELRGEF